MKKHTIFLFILGCFLFLNSNVKAFDMITNGDYIYNEEYVWKQFKNINGFNEDNNKILCSFSTSKSTGEIASNFVCYAFTEEQAKSITYSNGSNSNYWNLNFTSGTYYSVVNTTHPFPGYTYTGSSIENVHKYGSSTYFNNYLYANFNISNASDDLNSKINVLNFEKYKVELKFDANLFENDSDFKKVCLNEGISFAITPSEGNYSENGQYTDFIWFPYGLNNGLYKVQYDSSSEFSNGNIIKYSDDVMRENFYFSSYEEIKKIYNTDLPSDLEISGYTDKFSYYGYDAYKFFIVYKDGLFRFPVFTFDNPSKTHITSNGNIHSGGGLRLDGDEEIEISNEYCFYIKNGYEVTEVNINEWGDYNGTVNSPDGDYDFNTSHNEFESNTDSFLSQPIKFINDMKDTINFINSLIYEFYMSLPVLLRTFIITLLIVLIVMLIMRIGGYK